MGTVSVNRLGGLSLVLGFVIALGAYFISPGGLLVDAADPADGAASIGALVSNVGLANVTSLLIALGVIMILYGVYVVQGGIRDNGNGDALSRYGALLLLIGTVGLVTASALTIVVASGSAGPLVGAVYAIGLGVGQMSSIVGALGFLALSLALSTREDSNKVFALVAALASAILLVAGVIGGMDSAQLQSTNAIGGICYIVIAIWGITLGLGLMKKA